MNLKQGLAAAALAFAVVFPAGTASAAPPEIEHFHDVGSEPNTFCPGLNIQNNFDFSGSIRIVRQGKNGLPHFTMTYRGSVLLTNNDTGRSLRLERAGVERDLKVVDNGNGTLTIIVLATGTDRVYDNDGRLVFTNNGQIRFELLIDQNGTPDDYSDDEAEFIGITRPSNGTNGGDGRDFCADMDQFTS